MQQIPTHGRASQPRPKWANGFAQAEDNGTIAVGRSDGRGDIGARANRRVGGLGEPREVGACDVEGRGPGHGVEAVSLAAHFFKRKEKGGTKERENWKG